jgi:copper homeostasis protein
VSCLIEAAVESADQAAFAVRDGADRLEVCDFSVEGGRTPLEAAVRTVRAEVTCPLHLLIRPRGGGFHYAEPELRVIERQIDEAKQLGAHAVVLGVLRADRRTDRIALARLIGRSRPLEVVFHRAIDLCPDPVAEVEVLLTLGVDRVLTSGGAAVALEGAKVIRRMVEVAGQSLTVMAGGGVRARNVRELVERTGVSEVHARDVRGMRQALSA